jgi:hypothetical protein
MSLIDKYIISETKRKGMKQEAIMSEALVLTEYQSQSQDVNSLWLIIRSLKSNLSVA